jgi:hypothetical protein
MTVKLASSLLLTQALLHSLTAN